MQRVNIYKHVVNLKYGFGIETNNYFYKTPITYVDGASPLHHQRFCVVLKK